MIVFDNLYVDVDIDNRLIKMASKTISVTEEVYNLLKKAKLPQESFGDTIARLCRSYTTGNLNKWLKSTEGWEDMSEEEYKEFTDPIKRFQKKFKPFSVEED